PMTDEGEYKRDLNYLPDRITADGRDGWPVEPDRYRLVVARACPWANRAVIVRRLLGLEPVLSMGIAGPVHDERSWSFDLDPDGRDPVLGIERLQEAFFKRDPDYPRGITVPAFVDVPSGKVFTNVNNAVYQCGFARSQEAYEHSYRKLFSRLDWLSERLADQRYLVGDTI